MQEVSAVVPVMVLWAPILAPSPVSTHQALQPAVLGKAVHPPRPLREPVPYMQPKSTLMFSGNQSGRNLLSSHPSRRMCRSSRRADQGHHKPLPGAAFPPTTSPVPEGSDTTLSPSVLADR